MKLLVVAFFVCAALAEPGAQPTDSDIPSDDACFGDQDECSLSLRQLRGELRVAEVNAHSDEGDVSQEATDSKVEEQAATELEQSSEGELASQAQTAKEAGEGSEEAEEEGEEEDPIALADLDKDGEVQHHEAVSFLGDLGNHSDEDVLALFQAHDADASKGLNSREFAAALDTWGAGCSTRRLATFCMGAVRHCCCAGSWGWRECGCTHRYAACGVGYGGGYHYGYRTPYYGGYHAGGYSGGYHAGYAGYGGYHAGYGGYHAGYRGGRRWR